MEPAISVPVPDMEPMAAFKRRPSCISDPWDGVEPLTQALVAWSSLQEPPPFRAGECQLNGPPYNVPVAKYCNMG